MEKRDMTPIARFGLREEIIYFNRTTLILLGNPKYVQFLYEEKRKLLVVAGNNRNLPYSLEIPIGVYLYRMENFRICHKRLTEAFALRLGWDENENYSVAGVFNPMINAVVFELSLAAINESNPA